MTRLMPLDRETGLLDGLDLERLVRAIEDELTDDELTDEQRLQNIGERLAAVLDGA